MAAPRRCPPAAEGQALRRPRLRLVSAQRHLPGGPAMPAPAASMLPFRAASLLPLLAGAALWGLAAAAYLTLFTFALDTLIAASGNAPEGAEVPAADALLVTLALAQLAVLPLGVAVVAGATGLSWLERGLAFAGFGLFFGQVSNSCAHELIHRRGRGCAGWGWRSMSRCCSGTMPRRIRWCITGMWRRRRTQIRRAPARGSTASRRGPGRGRSARAGGPRARGRHGPGGGMDGGGGAGGLCAAATAAVGLRAALWPVAAGHGGAGRAGRPRP